MKRVLVSSCLLGVPVRYDGTDRRCDAAILAEWRAEGRLVPCCPEVDGGLPVPRPPAEIVDGHSGGDVLDGCARIMTAAGIDVTEAYLSGAKRAFTLVQKLNIAVAILQESSPSCGTHGIFDGTFTGTRVAGEGVTAALLRRHGVVVFSAEGIEDAARYLGER